MTSNYAQNPFVDEISGAEWKYLTKKQKHDTIEKGLTYLSENGITITEDEDFYVDALNKLYKDENMSYVPVAVALKTIGGLSETMHEEE